MDKQQLLQAISESAEAGTLSKAELEQAYDQGVLKIDGTVPAIARESEWGILRHLSVAEIFYYFGGMVAFVGVVILLGQNWDYFTDPIRVLLTLGLGALVLAAGIWLSDQGRLSGVGQSFILIGSLVFPLGVYVSLDAMGYKVSEMSTQSLIAALLAGLFLLGYWYFRKLLLLVSGIAWVTALYFFFTSFITESANFAPDLYFEYRLLIAGISYILLAYSFAVSDSPRRRLRGPLYLLGIIGFLSTAFLLGESSGIWEALFPLLALAAMLGSVYVRSRAFLVVGGLSLIAYIFKITGKYFADNVGWPVALIVAGFALVGIGYIVVSMNKKYFSRSKQ